jgi:hypothetical protein
MSLSAELREHQQVRSDASLMPERRPVIVTLVSGDHSGLHAAALLQSLRDVGTKLRIVVLLGRGGVGSASCHNQTWKTVRNRTEIHCAGPLTIDEEIVDPSILVTIQRLADDVRIIDTLPRTRFTESMPGAPSTFWGYALNKLA